MGVEAVGLREKGVLIEPGAAFFAEAGGGQFAHPSVPREFYRLAWSSIPAARIAEGVGLL